MSTARIYLDSAELNQVKEAVSTGLVDRIAIHKPVHRSRADDRE